MYVGHMLEWGDTEKLIHEPQHPYTQLLISAVPDPRKRKQKAEEELQHIKNKDIPIWSASSVGCPFVSRCPKAMDQCSRVMPEVTEVSENHFVRCFLYDKVEN